MIPYFDARRVRAALTYPDLISALRQAFQKSMQAPTRHVHTVSKEHNTVLLLMPTWHTESNMGVKLVTVAPDNPKRQLPTVHSIFILFETKTGVPIALIDGEELTLRRTAAASALASSYLSRSDSATLLVVGTGTLAPYMAAAHCVARPIRHIKIWGRSREKAERTAHGVSLQDLPSGVTVETVTDLEAAACGADIISCATTSTTPIVLGQWIRPGTHIDLVGGFKPDMRESDDALINKAIVFVDTKAGTLAEAGDLLQPIASGSFAHTDIAAELADLSSGRHAGRSNPQQITLFKSVGTGIEDLAAANLVWKSEERRPQSAV
jgi:ornithine cyclodeaminase/alanine dehydrogenase-like protein (mu-crystallin family)